MSKICPENVRFLQTGPEPVRPRKEPNDGPGPRGFPDCYYKSRVLNSTARYEKFVRRLRMTEEEMRKGQINQLKEIKDKQINDFFIRCDRRSLIKHVARQVDLCMKSYQNDLDEKRQRLVELLSKEEERDTRMFVMKVQEGTQQVWEDKMKRLQFLLDKRQKEHEEKYKDTPLSKCSEATPMLYKHRAKEAQQIQLYQMKENQARKLSEKEFDKMWVECSLKESDALSARMEQDAIERKRRAIECKEHSDYMLALKRKQQAEEREMLKQEQLAIVRAYQEELRRDAEEKQRKIDEARGSTLELEELRRVQEAMTKKLEEEDAKVNKVWESMLDYGIRDEKEKEELIMRKRKEQDMANKKLMELRDRLAALDKHTDCLTRAEWQKVQDRTDQRRCDFFSKYPRSPEAIMEYTKKELADRQKRRDELKQLLADETEYYKQLGRQVDDLMKYKAEQDKIKAKLYEKDLLGQIEYNNRLKEMEKQEEADQYQKGLKAEEDYKKEVADMLARPSHSEEVHPFMKKMMEGIKMKPKCPCSRPDHCAYCRRA